MRVLKHDPLGIHFMEILLDETICQGTIAIPKDLALAAGGYNSRLKAKQKYELILRIALKSPVSFIEIEMEEDLNQFIILKDHGSDENENAKWQADCYVIGKYSGELRQAGLFDLVVSSMIDQAEAEGRAQQTLEYLEEMIGHGEQYFQIDDAARPILIYKGDPVCHNILTVMAEQFGNALQQRGIPVEYFDCENDNLGELAKYMYQHFRAIVGVQSYMFSIKERDEVSYLHEKIYGPKYNFVFDHPIWFQHHLKHQLSNFCVLTNDKNYEAFYKRYNKLNAIFFPPAGMVPDEEYSSEKKRIYDITFIGNYGDYWNEVLLIHQMEKSKRFLANRFLLQMRKKPELTAEEAFRWVLDKKKMIVTDHEFLELFLEMRRIIYCVMSYYRHKVVCTILEAGIQLHVFGNSWEKCLLKKKYSNLVCHDNISVEKSLTIWQQSKLSLNVMSWHKAGFTERMASIMLAGAVLVTDDTTFLRGNYDTEDMLVFNLAGIKKLPEKILCILQDESKRNKIAERGRRKTMNEHTWAKRAEQFEKLMNRN